VRAHLRALAEHLGQLGYPVHLYRATGSVAADGVEVVPAVPYLVLRGAWDNPDEVPVSDEHDELGTEVRVTATATTAEGAGVVLERVRGLLSPRGSWTVVPMAGRSVQVKRARAEVEPDVDMDLRLPNSNRHPGFGVDSYRLHSSPIQGGSDG